MTRTAYVSDGARWRISGSAGSGGGRDPALQPFDKYSIWNLPISVDATYTSETDPATVDLIDPAVFAYMNASPSEFTIPVYHAGQNDPWATVFDETNAVGGFQAGGKWGFRVPSDAFPDDGTDTNIAIIDPAAHFSYEWHGLIKTGPYEFRSWRQPTEVWFDSGNAVFHDVTTQSVTFRLSDNRVVRASHELEDAAPIVFGPPTSGTALFPSNLTAGQTYYVKYINSQTFEIAATPGGSSLTFTTADSQNGAGRFNMGDGARMVVQKMYEGSDVLAFRNTLGGFDRSGSYYIVNSQIQGGLLTFSLSETPGGTAITPNATGYMRLTPIDTRHQTKGRVIRVNLHGDGAGPDGGSRAFEGSALGGLVRSWEIEAGEIKHAIAMACGKAQMNYDSGAAGYYMGSVNFTADNSNSVLTLASHGFVDGDSVFVLAAPSGSGITVPAVYYARDVTGSTLKLAATKGGSAITIAVSGTVTAREAKYGYGTELGYVWPATAMDSGCADAYGSTVTLTATSGSPTLTLNNHGYNDGDAVRPQIVPGGSNVTVSTTYFARDVTANSLAISSTVGGSAIVMSASGSITARRFGKVRMGQYFAIPWSVDVENLNLTPSGKILARAFQRYGSYVTDTAQETHVMCFVEKRSGIFDVNDPTIYFRNEIKAGPSNTNDWADLNTIRALLRRVSNNAKDTPNGGSLASQRRASLAADLQL